MEEKIKEYLFEISISGEGEQVHYIRISAKNIKEARKEFQERMKKLTNKEWWLFQVYKEI